MIHRCFASLLAELVGRGGAVSVEVDAEGRVLAARAKVPRVVCRGIAGGGAVLEAGVEAVVYVDVPSGVEGRACAIGCGGL